MWLSEAVKRSLQQTEPGLRFSLDEQGNTVYPLDNLHGTLELTFYIDHPFFHALEALS